MKLHHACVGVACSAVALAGCGERSAPAMPAGPVRLGYFANVTHAPAIVALEQGFFAEALGADVKLEPRTFNAGPEAVEALFSEALDVTYIGPNPAINAFAQSGGEAIRIVAGATSGGAALVVEPSITSPAQLVGKKLATPTARQHPGRGAARLAEGAGPRARTSRAAATSPILPQANAQTLETFRAGEIQGAWVPEPWATRLVLEGGGSVLVDERSLWPDGKFVTTHVIVRTRFLEEHPDLVAALLRAHVRAIDFLNAEPAKSREIVNAGIAKLGRQGAARRGDRARLGEPALHGRPDRGLAAQVRRGRDRGGPARPGEARRHLRPRPLNQILAASGKPPIAP